MLFYSQNFEDLYLWRCFREVECGFYIDVGCHDPEFESVTKVFYDNGWWGINVDPSLSASKLFIESRPRDINIHGFACDFDDSCVDFFEVEGTGRSTGSILYKELAERDGYAISATRVQSVCLNSLLYTKMS